LSKVFCIGHFKTGTTSYSFAVRMMGFRDIHFPLKYAEHLQETGSVVWDDRPWDSLSNINEVEYSQCDEAYPDSKFVLTTRDVDKWLVSIQRHMSTDWPPRLKRLLDWRSQVIFGCPCDIEAYDEWYFRRVFKDHEEAVCDYFLHTDQLLVLPLESGTKMQDLARFLGKDVPYPKASATASPSSPGLPMMVEDSTKEGYPKVPVFLQFEEPVQW